MHKPIEPDATYWALCLSDATAIGAFDTEAAAKISNEKMAGQRAGRVVTEGRARRSKSKSRTTRAERSSISTRPGSGPRSAKSWTACRHTTRLVHLKRRAHFISRMTGQKLWRRWESNIRRYT